MPPSLPGLLTTTSDSIPPHQITATLGFVNGNAVWSKHMGRDLMAGLKTLIGGEIRGYTEMLIEARAVAQQRMLNEARALGADAVVGVRLSTSSVMQGMVEVVAYGTAVKFRAASESDFPQLSRG